MAFKKEILLKNGVVANYHRIKRASFNYIENQSIIEISSYISKKYRDEEKKIENIDAIILALANQFNAYIQSNDIQSAQSLKEKLKDLTDLREDIISKKYFVDSSVITIDSVPEDISLQSLYLLLSTLETYSNLEEV